MPFAGWCRDVFRRDVFRSHALRPGRRGLGRRGTTSVEFALVGGLTALLLLGCLEMGRYLITREAVRTAAAEAVRMATLRGGQNLDAGSAACNGLSGSLAGVAARVPWLTAASLTATLSGCATQAGITTVTVTVQYPFTFVITLFGTPNRPITESAQAIVN